MDKSKKKRENPFIDYLWQTEDLLWTGRPLGQGWPYFRFLSVSESSGRAFNLPTRFAIGFIWAFALIWVSETMIRDEFTLSVTFIIFVVALLLVSILARSLSIQYPSRVTFYAITNRRILILRDAHFYEMQHELILMASIKQMNHYQTLIWDEGQVDFFPDFVGVEDAEYLVHLVEEARGENIPIVQKSWHDTIIYD